MKKIYSILLTLSILLTGVPAFSQENADTPAHVIINQVYGGGNLGDIETPVSHSFIELYNPTDKAVSLNGWSVQYAESGNSWKVLKLSGKIDAHCSYLIRCGAHNGNARLQISDYDLSWNIGINNKGLKVLLKSSTAAANTDNPFLLKSNDYVDMVGVAGNEYFYLIDGCETDYSQIQSKQKSVRRIKFQDTDNNAKDFMAVDYRTADLDTVRPRSSKDGEWTYTDFVRSKNLEKVPLGDTDTEFTFLHVSDTQASTKGQFEKWGALTSLLENTDYDFTIHTGDLTDNPDNVEEMDMFYENSGSIMKKPFIPVAGNHDVKKGTNAELFGEYFGTMPGTQAPLPVTPNTTASFDYGNAHFIILNSESDLDAQVKWLDEELSKTDKKWKIVAIHRSPYGAFGTNDTLAFTPVFDKHHVDLVIHGHDHLYLRTFPLYNGQQTDGGTVYLESGSSGIKQEAPIVRQSYQEVCISPESPTYSSVTVKDNEISVTAHAIGADGKLNTIDTFSITKYTGYYDDVRAAEYDVPLQYFSDIRADRPYRDAVMLMSQLGIIEKSVSFMPNDSITYTEFIEWLNAASGIYSASPSDGEITFDTALTEILNRLGYGAYIDMTGADRSYVASDIGLYKNLETASDGSLKRWEAAQLIANALEAYLIETDGSSGNSINYAQVYSSWLDKVHKVYKMTGIITDRPYYTPDSSDTSVTFINKYGEEIKAGYTEEIYPLLGYEIDAYIREPYEGGEMIYGVKTKRNNVLTVKKSWYGEVFDTTNFINFSYTDDNNSTDKVKIDKNACFVYNEALSDTIRQKALNKEKNAFKPSHIGKITLVDYNDDNVYDFVFIDNYKDIVVSGIDSDTCKITNLLAYQEGVSVKSSKYTEIPKICLDKTDTSYRVTFTSVEEKPSSFSSITKDCVISVALSSLDTEDPETARIRRVYISNLSAVGNVTSIFEKEEDDYFVVGGKAYRASKSYYNTYNGGESVDFSDINVGDYVSLYLDLDERIAYIAKESPTEQYGILISQIKDTTAGSDSVFVKIIDAQGNPQVYTVTEKKYKSLGISGISMPALVHCRTQGNRLLRVSADTELAEYGTMMCLKNSRRIGNYFYDDNTLMFLYQGSKNDENINDVQLYHTVTPDFLKNKQEYSMDIFDVYKYYRPAAAIIYYNNADIPLYDDNILLITQAVLSLNAENETVIRISGYTGGKEVSLEFAANETADVSAGDIIQYRTDPDGIIEKWQLLCGKDTAEFEKNTVFDDVFFAKYDFPQTVDGNILTVKSGEEYKNYFFNNNTHVYNIYSEHENEVYAGNVGSITSDDKIFIISREGIINEIFVWKED